MNKDYGYNNKIIVEGSYLDVHIFIEDHLIVEPERWYMWLRQPVEDEETVASALISPYEFNKFNYHNVQRLSSKHTRLHITVTGIVGFADHTRPLIAHNGNVFQKKPKKSWLLW